MSGSWAASAGAVIARPGLWGVAIRQSLRFAHPNWSRRPPFLPVPDPTYLRARLVTNYGRVRAPEPHDVVAYLEWCRAEEARERTRGRLRRTPSAPGGAFPRR